MRYYVLADDGNRYGPADVPTLNQWILEGRLLPSHFVVAELSQDKILATAIPGLMFPVRAPSGPGYQQMPYGGPQQPYQAYHPQSHLPAVQPGLKELNAAWVLGALSILFGLGCGLGFLLGIIGLLFASQANAAGNRQAKTAMLLCLIGICLPLLPFVRGFLPF